MARPGLTAHRKFRRLERALGSPILARGALELLWESCYEMGDDYVGTAADIEHLVGWSGEPGLLTRALVEAGAPEGQGFIELVTDAVNGQPAYRVHDLWHHAPDYVAKRKKRELERQQKTQPILGDRRTAPNGGQWSASPDSSAGVDRTPSPSHSPSHSPSPAPVGKNGSAETSSAPSLPPFLVFPVIGHGAGEWPLSEAQVAKWVALFPGLDVRAECRKALAWVDANKGNRKTFNGMERFLARWLTRAVDRGGVGRQSAVRPFTAKELDDAKRVRANAMGCPHDPRCPDVSECLAKIIRKWRGEAA